MSDFKHYDPGAIQVMFRNVLITGFVDGSFVEAVRDADSFEHVVGAAGDVCRIKSNNKSGVVTLSLLQTAPSNDVLSGFIKEDELTGLGFGNLQIYDANGTTLLVSRNSWIQKPADTTFSNGQEGRSWAIACAELDMFVGGSLIGGI